MKQPVVIDGIRIDVNVDQDDSLREVVKMALIQVKINDLPEEYFCVSYGISFGSIMDMNETLSNHDGSIIYIIHNSKRLLVVLKNNPYTRGCELR